MDKTIYGETYELLLASLRQARIKAGLRQQELAEKLDVDQSFIGKCERGERRLDAIELRSWCLALGTTVSHFMSELEVSITATLPPPNISLRAKVQEDAEPDSARSSESVPFAEQPERRRRRPR